MSPATDPVAFALGVLGLWLGLLALVIGGWVALVEFYAWRRRRRLDRRIGRRIPSEGWPDRS